MQANVQEVKEARRPEAWMCLIQCSVVPSSQARDSFQLSDPYPPLSQTVNYYCPLNNYKAKCKLFQPECTYLSRRQCCQREVMQSVYAILFLGRGDACWVVCSVAGSDFTIRQQRGMKGKRGTMSGRRIGGLKE